MTPTQNHHVVALSGGKATAITTRVIVGTGGTAYNAGERVVVIRQDEGGRTGAIVATIEDERGFRSLVGVPMDALRFERRRMLRRAP